MGRTLEREYNKALKNVELFGDLQKCREMDFPKNLNYIYVQNFDLSLGYYETSMMKTICLLISSLAYK